MITATFGGGIGSILLPKTGGGLGPGVSALPMGPMDVPENYIFEISVKNWKNEPEENFLEGFFNLTVSKKRGAFLTLKQL
jgi:hypothetical protein